MDRGRTSLLAACNAAYTHGDIKFEGKVIFRQARVSSISGQHAQSGCMTDLTALGLDGYSATAHSTGHSIKLRMSQDLSTTLSRMSTIPTIIA